MKPLPHKYMSLVLIPEYSLFHRILWCRTDDMQHATIEFNVMFKEYIMSTVLINTSVWHYLVTDDEASEHIPLPII